MNEEKFIHQIASRFDGEVLSLNGELTVLIAREHIASAAAELRQLGFERLSDITAVDYFPQEAPRFHLVYQFTSVAQHATLSVRAAVPGVNPAAPSLEKVYPNANWREREVFDMFGIVFEGHSDMRRILMPHDWQGHPLRKDYPLGYEEPQYSFNFDEISLRKPSAKRDAS